MGWREDGREQTEHPRPLGVSGEELVYTFDNGIGETGRIQITVR